MEHGTIEREIHIAATPEVVYDVISQPEHIAAWWGFDATFPPGLGDGRMTRERRDGTGTYVTPVTVLEAQAPHRFAFRWVQPEGEVATSLNSFLVTFDLSPVDGGTLLRLTEAGFREVEWEAAKLEAAYLDHSRGWDEHLAKLATYAADLVRP